MGKPKTVGTKMSENSINGGGIARELHGASELVWEGWHWGYKQGLEPVAVSTALENGDPAALATVVEEYASGARQFMILAALYLRFLCGAVVGRLWGTVAEIFSFLSSKNAVAAVKKLDPLERLALLQEVIELVDSAHEFVGSLGSNSTILPSRDMWFLVRKLEQAEQSILRPIAAQLGVQELLPEWIKERRAADVLAKFAQTPEGNLLLHNVTFPTATDALSAVSIENPEEDDDVADEDS
jgi:hypothetical protein